MMEASFYETLQNNFVYFPQNIIASLPQTTKMLRAKRASVFIYICIEIHYVSVRWWCIKFASRFCLLIGSDDVFFASFVSCLFTFCFYLPSSFIFNPFHLRRRMCSTANIIFLKHLRRSLFAPSYFCLMCACVIARLWHSRKISFSVHVLRTQTLSGLKSIFKPQI